MMPTRLSRVCLPTCSAQACRLRTDYVQLGDNPLGWKKRFEVIAMIQTRSYSPQQCRAQVIALWHADTESMLVDAELYLPRVITILCGDSQALVGSLPFPACSLLQILSGS